MRAAVRPIAPATLDDLRLLLGTPPEGWCWCVAWEVPGWDGWAARRSQQNRALREQLWQAGAFHGFVFYLDDAPSGWCRVGPAGAWPKFCESRGVAPAEGLFAFTCFGMRPAHRRQGHLHRFLALAMAEAARQGATAFVAAPKRLGPAAPDGEAWNGPLSLFLKAGFEITATHARYWLVRREAAV